MPVRSPDDDNHWCHGRAHGSCDRTRRKDHKGHQTSVTVWARRACRKIPQRQQVAFLYEHDQVDGSMSAATTCSIFLWSRDKFQFHEGHFAVKLLLIRNTPFV